MIRGKWLLLVGLVLLILFLSMREREHCPNPDDVWVLSDRGWICIRQ